MKTCERKMKVGKFCFYIEIVLSKKAEKNERKRCKLCKIDSNKRRNTNKKYVLEGLDFNI